MWYCPSKTISWKLREEIGNASTLAHYNIRRLKVVRKNKVKPELGRKEKDHFQLQHHVT